jgi:hypothetical protein
MARVLEETYRYLIASDLSWRTLDIVQGHSLRWLVEVFIQDWKGHEGWAQLTKQPGVEGARQSVILSLLVDHSLFVHPDQQAQLKNNLPAYTVGSLRLDDQVFSACNFGPLIFKALRIGNIILKSRSDRRV